MENRINQELLVSRLKEYRKEKGYTQAEIAEMIGISTVNYAKYECGTRLPSLQKLVDIAYVLEKPLESFLNEERHEMKLTRSQIQHLRTLEPEMLKTILEHIQNLYFS